MKKIWLMILFIFCIVVLAGCGGVGSYSYRRYESYGGDENSYWYFRWEQKSDHRRIERQPSIHYGTDIYYYGGRTQVKAAPSKDEEKKAVAVKNPKRRTRSARTR